LPVAHQFRQAQSLAIDVPGATPRASFAIDWAALIKGAANKMENTKRNRSLATKFLAMCAFCLVCRAIIPLPAAAAETYQITVERNVPATMRDGVILRADIYRPKAEGKFPVLLTRTPYDKQWQVEFALKAVPRGYVVIAQDTRGQFRSEGEWYPFKYESQDGYDTVEWAAALPYSNGKVGMFGGSYVGATQYLAAIAHPPHLAGICPNVTASNYHDGWTYQGGAFEQWFDES
jgi:predicted acyl esterase